MKPIIGLLMALIPYASAMADEVSSSKLATPQLLKDWTVSVLGREGTIDEARAAADAQRPAIAGLPDPFTPLASMSCADRLAVKGEIVVWEDDAVLVVVDKYDKGPKLLVTPSKPTNFPTDLTEAQLAHIAQVAAAACEAMTAAANQLIAAGSCDIRINPPRGLSLKQMHVHVRSAASGVGTNDAGFVGRTAKAMRVALDGKGCV